MQRGVGRGGGGGSMECRDKKEECRQKACRGESAVMSYEREADVIENM